MKLCSEHFKRWLEYPTGIRSLDCLLIISDDFVDEYKRKTWSGHLTRRQRYICPRSCRCQCTGASTHTQQWPCLRRGPVLEEIKAQLFDDLFLTFVAQRIYSTVGPFFNLGFPP